MLDDSIDQHKFVDDVITIILLDFASDTLDWKAWRSHNWRLVFNKFCDGNTGLKNNKHWKKIKVKYDLHFYKKW